MNRDQLKFLYAMNVWTVDTHLEGITHEESLTSPPHGANHLNWVLGHILMARGGIHETLGVDRVLTPAQLAPYARGHKPGADDPFLPLEELAGALHRSQEAIEAGIDRISDEALARPLPEGNPFPPSVRTVDDSLAFLHFHECYHCGQIGLLRRLLGKPGRIA